MQDILDASLRQLWELEIEHATLARVIKGVTEKDAALLRTS